MSRSREILEALLSDLRDGEYMGTPVAVQNQIGDFVKDALDAAPDEFGSEERRKVKAFAMTVPGLTSFGKQFDNVDDVLVLMTNMRDLLRQQFEKVEVLEREAKRNARDVEGLRRIFGIEP